MTENQVNTIYQKIVTPGEYACEVVSGRERFYKVKLSDRVRLTMTAETGDMAVIKTYPDGWLIVDLEKRERLGEYDTNYEREEYCTDLIDKLKVRRKNLIRKTKLEVLELEAQIDAENKRILEEQLQSYDDILGSY